jgi:hypothetical protein
LGAIENGVKGSVSRSIMEYLGRPYRHLNAIGLYDKMAIAYGYAGLAPKHLDWFCTDEDQGMSAETLVTQSPECTKSDATSDPFSFWEARLERSIELLLETKSASAPVWTLEELETNISEAVTGLSAYALSAEKTSSTWTNFFGKANRPETVQGVKEYVLESLKNRLCDPALEEVIGSKESAEAQMAAKTNLELLRTMVALKTSELKLYSAEQINCQ